MNWVNLHYHRQTHPTLANDRHYEVTPTGTLCLLWSSPFGICELLGTHILNSNYSFDVDPFLESMAEKKNSMKEKETR